MHIVCLVLLIICLAVLGSTNQVAAKLFVSIHGERDKYSGDRDYKLLNIEKAGDEVLTVEEAFKMSGYYDPSMNHPLIQVLDENDIVIYQQSFDMVFKISSDVTKYLESSSTLASIPNIDIGRKIRIINEETSQTDDIMEYDNKNLPDAFAIKERRLNIENDYIEADEVSDHRRVLYNYDPVSDGNKFHLLFLGSRYTNSARFLEQANKIKDQLLKTEPFSFHKDDIIIHFYNRPDFDMDCSVEISGVGIECDRNLVKRMQAEFERTAFRNGVEFIDEILVIHYHPPPPLIPIDLWIGCGTADVDPEPNFYRGGKTQRSLTFARLCGEEGSRLAFTAIHELGHSFGALCDE